MIKKIMILITGNIKLFSLKLFHIRGLKYCVYNNVSIFSEIEIKNKGEISLGKKFVCNKNCRISSNGGKIVIGNYSGVNNNCYIVSHSSIKIGNNVEIGPNVVIVDHDHDYKREFSSNNKHYFKSSDIEIGDNVWIGANSVILRGSKIGSNSIIGAGSIVNSSIPNNSIYIQKRETKIESINK